MSSPDSRSVDIGSTRSVSFAPPEVPVRDHHALTPFGGVPVPVGPGRPAPVAPLLVAGGMGEGMDGHPVQPAKVQRPAVRDETLARDRLLDWLHAKVHHRVVLLVAEAGYGKTTLLADFSRRTRVRTLWYRLDETDGNWVSFLWHLIAAGREVDPAFATVSASLLSEVAIAGPSRDAVIEAFVRDLAVLAETGAAFVLDDYHFVDESEDVRLIMRRLLAAAPERVAFVLATRRQPALPLARLRAQGEVAELSTEDLRFDESETERLFRESYGRPLEPDVLAELSRRTEGWAASLQLVQAALQQRSGAEVRRFVTGLHGNSDELRDYLAEEVFGALGGDEMEFASRTSMLTIISPETVTAVTGLPPDVARSRIANLERLGLLSARGRQASGRTYHPLVKDLLLDRLRQEMGPAGVRDLHEKVARTLESHDWVLACHHFLSADQPIEVRRILDERLATILGAGGFAIAGPLVEAADAGSPWATAGIVRSRLHLHKSDRTRALASARAALALEPNNVLALANLVGIEHLVGNVDEAAKHARILEERATRRDLAQIGLAVARLVAYLDQPVDDVLAHLDDVATNARASGHLHYAGIAHLNAAVLQRVRGDAVAALREATEAQWALESASNGQEVAVARLSKAWALSHLGDLQQARAEIAEAVGTDDIDVRRECLIEASLIETWYGDVAQAKRFLDAAEGYGPLGEDVGRALALAKTQWMLRSGTPEVALRLVADEPAALASAWPDQVVQHRTLQAQAALAVRRNTARRAYGSAVEAARGRRSSFWLNYLTLLEATTSRASDGACDAVTQMLQLDPAYVSILAESVTQHLGALGEPVLEMLSREVLLRPERWRDCLRRVVDSSRGVEALPAARLLELIGTEADVARLRTMARGRGVAKVDPNLGRRLARRLAPRIYVDDQLRVTVSVGGQHVPGSSIRRKVLALLCFLTSRPDFAATRDQVVDALWPDLDPEVAVNSLNQTIYFLRRVFEPEYKEQLSPGYVHHDSDIVWLDRELVSARSAECVTLLESMASEPDHNAIEALVGHYAGKFALDFAYEEWAVPYRDSLHASFLQVVERSVMADIASGHYDRAINLARRGLSVDPDAEQLEVSLVRLYKLTGAHAAAAEQYAHYASLVRSELGVDPPPLAAL